MCRWCFLQGGWGTYLFGAKIWDGHWGSTTVYNARADVQSVDYFGGPWTSQPPRNNFTRWGDVFLGLSTWEGSTLQYHEFWYVWIWDGFGYFDGLIVGSERVNLTSDRAQIGLEPKGVGDEFYGFAIQDDSCKQSWFPLIQTKVFKWKAHYVKLRSSRVLKVYPGLPEKTLETIGDNPIMHTPFRPEVLTMSHTSILLYYIYIYVYYVYDIHIFGNSNASWMK